MQKLNHSRGSKLQPVLPVLHLPSAALILAAALAFLLVLAPTIGSGIAAQAPDRSINPEGPTEVIFHLNYVGSTDPVKVTHVMLGDKEVPLDTPVPVSGMWFRKIGVVIQNISPKSVVEGGITLWYPETGNGTPSKPTLTSPFSLGRRPSNAYMQRDGTRRDSSREDKAPEINVRPGESMTFGAHDGVEHTYGDVDQPEAYKLAGHPITTIDIVLDRFYFDDGSLWFNGKFYIPEPPPVVWKEITPAEFSNSSAPEEK